MEGWKGNRDKGRVRVAEARVLAHVAGIVGKGLPCRPPAPSSPLLLCSCNTSLVQLRLGTFTRATGVELAYVREDSDARIV